MKPFRMIGVVLGVVAAAYAPSRLHAQEAIKIGHLASITGPEANFGVSADRGIALAVAEQNAAGGVLGRQIEIVTVDDQSKNQEVNNCMVKLIQQDKVCAILGEIASSNTIAAAPSAERAKIPLVTPGSTNPEVTRKGEYIFRVCFTDDFQGRAIAGFAYQSLGVHNAAIITDQASSYSINLSKTVKEEFEKRGGKVVLQVSYKKTDSDYNAQVNQVIKSKPDVVFMTGYYTNVGNIAKLLRAAGFTGPCVGGDGWDGDTLYQIGGKALDNCYFTNHYSPDDPNPKIQAFITKYKAKYGTVPDAMAVLGYDAALVLMDAIKRAGATDGPKVRDALASTKDVPGLSGMITIDKDRNAKKGIVVVGIKDAKQYLKQVWTE